MGMLRAVSLLAGLCFCVWCFLLLKAFGTLRASNSQPSDMHAKADADAAAFADGGGVNVRGARDLHPKLKGNGALRHKKPSLDLEKSNTMNVPTVVKAFRKAKLDWHELLPAHNSICERYGNSEDPNFQFMKLVHKEQALTNFLTQYDRLNGRNHGGLSAYQGCNLLADPCMIHDSSSCARDQFCEWDKSREVCVLGSRQAYCRAPVMFSWGESHRVPLENCKRVIHQPLILLPVNDEEANMFYHWFDKFRTVFLEWKTSWGRRDVHFVLTKYPNTQFFEYFGLLSDNCWRRIDFIPEGTCFCSDGLSRDDTYATRELLPQMMVVLGLSHLLIEPLPTRPTLGLISRRFKRFILNQDELILVAEELGFDVVVLELESMTLYEQVLNLRRITVLAGMHGSGLSNGLLMRPGTVMLQLLPYNVEYRSGFPGVAGEAQLIYMELKVQRREHTFVHWDFLPEVSATHRETYLSKGSGDYESPEVFSFWINQDSIIDPKAFKQVLAQILRLGVHTQLKQKHS